MKVTVIETPSSDMGALALIYDMKGWPERTLRARGWLNAHVIYERDATAAEAEDQRQSPRYLAWRFESWEKLVNDEAREGIDAEECRRRWRAQLLGEDGLHDAPRVNKVTATTDTRRTL